MPVAPQPVLAAILVASGLGALVMCLLVLRYGFAAPPEAAREARRREIVVRLGHALAGACFAAVASLSVALIAHAQREAGGAPRVMLGEHEDLEHMVDARVAGVADRIAALESRANAMESWAALLDGRVAETRDRLGEVASRVERAAPVETACRASRRG